MSRLIKILGVLIGFSIILNLIWDMNIKISIEFYFLYFYTFITILTMFLTFAIISNILSFKIWNKEDLKDSIVTWVVRTFFLIILILELKYYFIPMSMDVLRIFSGNYAEINGTIETVEYNHTSGSRRHMWNEKEQHVYFKEEKSNKIVKITFHANAEQIMYSSKKIYYLPHTKWGMRVE